MIHKKMPTSELKKQLKHQRRKSEAMEILRQYEGEDEVVHVTKALEYAPEAGTRIDTGMGSLDEITDGLRTGELVVVSGPTGQGKTTLLQSFTYTFDERDVPSLWLSYEIGVRDLAKRFGKKMPGFYLPKKTRSSNVEWLRKKIWEGVAKYDTKVVFIDHLHYLLDMDELAKTNTSLAIGHLMRRLKQMAIETETLIFLVSHLAKTKFEAVPEISDLRDSSFVGQESDFVFLVWRDEDQSFLKVAKNRRIGTLRSIQTVFVNGRLHEVAR